MSHTKELWIPGLGDVPFNIMGASDAVSEYDADLMLGRNEVTGDWVVLIKNGPHDGKPFPIFTLGQKLPSSDEIQRKLYHADVRRRGPKIVADIERRNDARRKELDDASHDAAGEVAETVDWGFRRMGWHPNPRIFVPSGRKD